MEKLKPNISAIVIARNEADRIGECLKQLQWTREIIVVDNNSTDNTKQIAEQNQAQVFLHKTKDFSELRSFGQTKAHGKWILYIDADEIVSPELQKEIIQVCDSTLVSEELSSAYYIYRQNFYLNYSWPTQDKMIRLFQKDRLVGWQGSLHESANVN